MNKSYWSSVVYLCNRTVKFCFCELSSFKNECALHIVFDDIGVDLCNSINSVGSYDAEVSHVYFLLAVLLYQRHAAHTIQIPREQRHYVLQTHTGAHIPKHESLGWE